MSIDEDQASDSTLQTTNDSAIHSFQPFKSLPDEVLLLLLDQLSPFERCLVLSICKKWNQTILQRTSFFQYLTIPNRLSVSTALSVLKIFGLRSAFTLKHVIIHTRVEDTEDLDGIFTELRKSSASLNLLFLVQPFDFQVKTRNFSRKFLSNLNTLSCSTSRNTSQREANMWQARTEVGITGKEKSLQYYSTTTLFALEEEELEWLSHLRCFFVRSITTVKDLHSVLGAAKSNLQQLDLDDWIPNLDRDLPNFYKEKIELPNLQRVILPTHEATAEVLSNFLLIPDRQQILFAGYIPSLRHFDLSSQEDMYIRLKTLSDGELGSHELKVETELFFHQSSSIIELTLEEYSKPSNVRSRESSHLDFILELLSLPRQVPGRSDEDCLLPELESLAILNPLKLNKKLLKQFWETRKEKKTNLEIEVVRAGEMFEISRWGGEDWLNEED